MKDNVIEFIDSVVNTIIFTSAIGMLVAFLGVLVLYNRDSVLEFKTKSSVSMNTVNGYSDDLIYVNGSEVFNDIVNIDEALPVYLNGTHLTEDYLRFLRENNTTYIDNLRTMLDLNGEYTIKHVYYSNNELKAIYYERR